MLHFLTLVFSILLLACASNVVCGQRSENYLRRVFDASKDVYGYVNVKGDTVVAMGKYLMCYTDKFYKLAIVSSKDNGLVGINRNGKILFNVYVFDNGPDYPSNGLFRIVKDKKIGYANLDGRIVIKPSFDCAYPFRNNKAKVGKGCKEQTDGEHYWWTGGQWFTIDKKGNIIHTN